jgi:hypothetical protein
MRGGLSNFRSRWFLAAACLVMAVTLELSITSFADATEAARHFTIFSVPTVNINHADNDEMGAFSGSDRFNDSTYQRPDAGPYRRQYYEAIPFLDFASTSFARLVTVLSTDCAP